jgi:hypothetical protein
MARVPFCGSPRGRRSSPDVAPNRNPQIGVLQISRFSSLSTLCPFFPLLSFLLSLAFCSLRAPFDRPRLMELLFSLTTRPRSESPQRLARNRLCCQNNDPGTQRTAGSACLGPRSRTTNWIKSSPSEEHPCYPPLPPSHRLRRLHGAGRLLSSPFLSNAGRPLSLEFLSPSFGPLRYTPSSKQRCLLNPLRLLGSFTSRTRTTRTSSRGLKS